MPQRALATKILALTLALSGFGWTNAEDVRSKVNERENEAKVREEKAAKESVREERAAAKETAVAAIVSDQAAIKPLTQPSGDNYAMAHYNRQRNGWNPNETVLSPANVTTNNTVSGAHNFNTPSAGFFGEIWNTTQFGLSGSALPHMYASPLYVDSVALTSGTYTGDTMSVVYAATGNCDVYAVCAIGTVIGSTSIPAGTVLWQNHLGSPGGGQDGCNLGVLATPVIDLNATPPTMYFGCNISGKGWEIFALDITSGATRSGWPVVIADSAVSPVLQNGPAQFGSSGNEGQRGALNLSADGTKLYVPFGDYSDNDDGFLIVIDTGSKSIVSAFAGCQNPGHSTSHAFAGMWSATGPAVDSNGRIYATTGNTTVTTPDVGNFGMSLLVFGNTLPLALVGTYTPWNYVAMENNDMDLCGGGPNVLPDLSQGPKLHTVAFGGKQGMAYLLDRDNLPGGTTQRPANNLKSNQDGSLLPTTAQSISDYTNGIGPLSAFGPYSESGNNGNAAKARTTPAVYQTADGTSYLVYTGATKSGGGQTAIPPCILRVKVDTSASGSPYLSIDGSESTETYLSPGSPVVSSNGTSNFVAWSLDANEYRGTGLVGSHPYLVAVDPTTMKVIYQTAVGTSAASNVSTLHAGGKYNEPSVAHNVVFVGTDRVQAFGVTSYVYAIGCGGSGGPGNTTSTNSSPNAGGTINVTGTTTGKTFNRDLYFNGGQIFSTASAINVSGVSNPAPLAVYQNSRIGVTGSGNPSGGFTYTFPNLTPGANYSVRLHFAEINASVTGTGQRKFNVSINGNQLLTNYDIFANAGGKLIACEEPFQAIADPVAGTITVVFSSTGSTFPPSVNGIEVNALPNSIAQEYWFDWLAQYSLVGVGANPSADALNDGVSNVWKYLTNSSPYLPGDPTKLLPKMSETASGGSTYLQFSYLRRNDGGISYQTRGFSVAVQTCTDLHSWTTQPASEVSVTNNNDGTETAVLRLNSPIPPGTTNLFARVQLTLANN